MIEKMLLLAAFAAVLCVNSQTPAGESPEARREQAKGLLKDGNYRDAAEIFEILALDATQNPRDASRDLQDAVACLRRVGMNDEAASLLDRAEKAWSSSWRVLTAVATLKTDAMGQGARPPVRRRIGGVGLGMPPPFIPRRGGPGLSDSVRAMNLRLFLQAEKHLDDPADPAQPNDKMHFYSDFSHILMTGRDDGLSWRLTSLTDLDNPPDAAGDQPFYAYPQRRAPVDGDGEPVYYHIPASWEGAGNDGERWRWLLEKMAESGDASARPAAELMLGRFLLGQFGVQTVTQDSPLDTGADIGGDTGPFAVRTLGEDETIARLATGMKRFKMPAEFNHIRILRNAAATDNADISAQAMASLAQLFENRQQYPKAADLWRKIAQLPADRDNAAKLPPDSGDGEIIVHPPVPDPVAGAKALAEQSLKRITGNDGLIEAGPVAPAGSKTKLTYLFRNGKKVHFTARRLDERKLIRDIRNLLKSEPEKILGDWSMRSPSSLGRWVVEKNETQYIAETAAEWDVALEPLPDHYSRRTEVELPFDRAGCYLIEAAMEDGNTSRIVLWIQDLALVRKSSGDSQLLFAADAGTGELVPGVDLTFLGYDGRWGPNDRAHMSVEEFADRTDVSGLALVETKRLEKKQWLITADAPDGRLAYLGFDGIWRMGAPEEIPDNESFFIITDRPVYRPGQDINFKLWYGYSDYSGRRRRVDGRDGKVVIRDPRGDVVYEKTLTTDEFGGADDKITLDDKAPLGQYYMYVDGPGGGSLSFRLEEYKKPEFEVTLDSPDRALALGDSVQLKVRAKYYFGAPVQNGRVTYKIVRTAHADRWNPPWRWDWLYGPGTWRRTYDYSWYPGFADWGVPAPLPPWLPHLHVQPEIVAEGEGELDADGLFRITLDTAPAKGLYGNQDHSYAVTCEVTDQSRRTITGGGKVVASRRPFAVRVWTNRGYYRVGEEMTANVRASRPLGGGVRAGGTATIYRVNYDENGVPKETAVSTHKVQTDDDGNVRVDFEIKEAGQYRVACKLEDGEKNAVEGSALLTVRGSSGDGDFRFSGLELVPDRRDYRPGETLRLAVNSENKGGVVLFFARAERNGTDDGAPSGRTARPELVRLENGSHIVEIPVGRADRPNFFCEALMVYKGRLYSEVREIFVPPADRTLNVAVESDAKSYGPGGRASFTVRVTDADGEPVVGQCVVSIYDRAVEYISGGTNIADIRSHFWNWKRFYDSHVADSLAKAPFSPERPDDVHWRPIGVFGSQEADWNDTAVYTNGRAAPQMRTAGYGGGVMMAKSRMMTPQPVPMAAAPMMAGANESFASADMAMDAVMSAEAAPAPASGGGGFDGGDLVEPTARTDFADTALWLAALETNADGVAAFTADLPENLTAWKVRTWVMGDSTRVGDGEEAIETKKNVIVRPQAPRFLTQKDQVVLSANLHNYLPRAKKASAQLILEGGLLSLAPESKSQTQNVELAANGEARVDWIVDAKRPGAAKVAMRLLTDEESDAAEITVPVVVHGSRRVVNFGGVMRDGVSGESIRFAVPAERLPEQSRLEFSFSPTVATSLLEAIPFLIEYPYGCTEQTLNRFLPAVMARRFLDGMGATLADAKKAVDNRRDDPQSKEWRARWGDPRSVVKDSPVFDDDKLTEMVRQGSDRLLSMRNADGGWGWFSGTGEKSWPHTTAVVVHGLQAAVELGAPVPPHVLKDGVDWLTRYQAEQVALLKARPEAAKSDKDAKYKGRADNLDAFVYMILARDNRRPLDPDMRDFLYRDRLSLSQTGLAMLGIGLHYEKATNALDMVVDNLRQYLRRDAETNAAWLETPTRGWWWWYNDGIETQAWYLKLLSLVEPKGAAASEVAKYILRNRKNGSYWRSTRDTAYAIEALVDYAKASGESEPDMTVAVHLDGEKVMERKITAQSLLDDNRFVLEGVAVEEGEHEIRLERSGGGNVYYTGGLDLFSLEDPIKASGLELKVTRAFSKLVRKDGTVDMPTSAGVVVQGAVERYEKVPLPVTGETALASGDLVEVELELEALNDYEYLVFEDMKAAGLEAVELRSGYSGDGLGAYVEYRDDKVAVFIRYLPKGTHRLRYRFRAEVPGRFSALPTFGGGMYATDLFTNSDEAKIRIHETGVYEK